MNCKSLLKSTKPRPWISGKIKELESIHNRTPLQQFQLCSYYETLTLIPFMPSQIYPLCVGCPLKVDPDVVWAEMGKVTQHAV